MKYVKIPLERLYFFWSVMDELKELKGEIMGNLKNQDDYSKYKCPYSNIEKDCGHELKGPEGYEDTYSVWCACGFRGPVFCLDPEELQLEIIY